MGLSIEEVQSQLYQLRTENERLKSQLEAKDIELNKLTKLTDNLPVFISHISKDLRYTLVNQTYVNIFGRPKNEIVNKPIEEIIGKEGLEKVWSHNNDIAAGTPIKFINRTKDKDGVDKILQVTYIPEKDGDEVKGFFLLAIDISEFQYAENVIRQREFEFNEIRSIPGVGVWSFDPLTEQIHWSKEMFRIAGLPPVERDLDVSILKQVIHPDDFPAFNTIRQNSIDTGEPFLIDLRVVRPDKSIRIVVNTAETIVDQFGKVVKLRGVIRDVTESRKMQESLRDSEAKYRYLFDNSIAPVFIIDLTGKLLSVNHAALVEYRYTLDEMMELNIRDIDVPDEASKVEERMEAITSAKDHIFETRHRRQDGTELEVYVEAKKICFEGMDAILSIHRNISEEKRKERIINEKNEALLKLNAEKDKFFSIISHDLRSPLNAVVALADLLKGAVDEPNMEEVKEYTQMIVDSSNKAVNLLKNLIDWSRSQTGRIVFSPVHFDIAELIDELKKVYGVIAEQKEITLTVETPENLFVNADKDMIGTVLRNLISNAIKFTYPKGHIVIKGNNEDGHVRLSVRDNGVGIPKVGLDKLLNVNTTYSTYGTQNEQGTGLGLILCKEFIDKHQGKFWIESEEGKGSEFIFWLPC
jgi:PAS domain S-box-containing protein